jgi:hypothetical protein
MRSTTSTIIEALHILSHDIQSDDGVANACIAEAAGRLTELHTENKSLKRQVSAWKEAFRFLKNSLLEEYSTAYTHALATAQGVIAEGRVVTTVEYSSSQSCWAVRCNGELMDFFATREEAERFANEHDTVITPTEVADHESVDAA